MLIENEIAENRSAYSVTQLNQLSRKILESEIGPIWIEGELSNFKAQISSGHLYFSVKDENSQIRAACFAYQSKLGQKKFKDGDQVLIFGKVTLYEKSGTYQIIVQKMEPKGLGKLQQLFEQLKMKLMQEGLFDQSYKKEIPLYPSKIGVITSQTGAAIKDFIRVLFRRNQGVHLSIYSSLVQGDDAPGQLIDGIRYFNRLNDVDVIVLTRGGGSMEDLWCFNHEELAREIFQSHIPIVNAVGHEIDWTIADYVADLRAPTPSAAAEMVVKEKESILNQVESMNQIMQSFMENKIKYLNQKLHALAQHYVLKEPINYIRQQMQFVDDIQNNIDQRIQNIFERNQSKLIELNSRFRKAIPNYLKFKVQKLHQLVVQLEALSPLKVLTRGYSVTFDSQNKAISSIHEVDVGHTIRSQLSDGSVISQITKKS